MAEYWVGSEGMAAGEPLPGSEQDPLVSKSYVDSKIEALLSPAVVEQMEVVELPADKTNSPSRHRDHRPERSAVVIDSVSGGLCDVTAGKDQKGENAPANHLLLVPRDDGRGIQAVSGTIVMVRGTYTLE